MGMTLKPTYKYLDFKKKNVMIILLIISGEWDTSSAIYGQLETAGRRLESRLQSQPTTSSESGNNGPDPFTQYQMTG